MPETYQSFCAAPQYDLEDDIQVCCSHCVLVKFMQILNFRRGSFMVYNIANIALYTHTHACK